MIECRGIYLPDGETHLVDMIERMPKVDGRGAYQYHKWTAVQGHVTNRTNAIDVGSHVGLWTIQLVKFFQENVYCFEPVADHRECWKANLAPELNPKAVATPSLFHCALGPVDGTTALMRRHAGSSGHTFVDPNVNGSNGDVAEVKTLDSFELTGIGFIKIDCEGFEKFVLEGARETLMRERPVVLVEQKPGHADRYGIGTTDAVGYLEQLGARKVSVMSGDYLMKW